MPRTLVLHSTEGTTMAGAIAAMDRNRSWSNWVCNPTTGELATLAAGEREDRSLRNLAGGVETNNRPGVWQLEIVGRATEIPTKSNTWFRSLANIIIDICNRHQIPKRFPYPFVAYPASYGINAAQRLTGAQWLACDGIVGHQHVPENCVTVDTPVLTADLQWTPAVDLAVGDELIGFDEHNTQIGATAGRRVRPSIVEANAPFKAEALRVVTDHGDLITTRDHPWLIRLPYVNRGTRSHWVTSENLDPGKHAPYWACEPWTTDRSHAAGWLAGLLDADGHAQTRRDRGTWVGFGQVHGPVLDRFVAEMESRGFLIKQFERGVRAGGGIAGKQPFVDLRVNGGMWEQLRALGTLRPHRLDLRAAWDGAALGKVCPQRVTIYAVEPAGERWMAGLQTSTRTYIAGGFPVHNTHGDPGDISRVVPYVTGGGSMAHDDAQVDRLQRFLLSKGKTRRTFPVDLGTTGPAKDGHDGEFGEKTASAAIVSILKLEDKVRALERRVDEESGINMGFEGRIHELEQQVQDLERLGGGEWPGDVVELVVELDQLSAKLNDRIGPDQ